MYISGGVVRYQLFARGRRFWERGLPCFWGAYIINAAEKGIIYMGIGAESIAEKEVRQMNFEDEKDYIMRIIKEMVRVLFSLMFGKEYVSVEWEAENKYEVSGRRLSDLLDMVDRGAINEAENLLLEGIDYGRKEDVAVAALFYQHLSGKQSDFLLQNNYSKEEVLEGLNQVVKQAGYGHLTDILE